MTNVAIIDYGMGNLRSVGKAAEYMSFPPYVRWLLRKPLPEKLVSAVRCVAPRKARVRIVNTAEGIRKADRIIFPGQGAIGSCMRALDEAGLRAAVTEALRSKPFLGICLGLQALYESSEEDGGTPGLAALRGCVRRFDPPAVGTRFKVPHMGWNQVRQERPHSLWRGIAQDTRFYFVHSFYAESADVTDVAGSTDYGHRFTSAATRENIFAVQFHPEKSQQAGLQLLANFIAWDGSA
ncbi:MAG: imidazole glycerol phosphate synthase subunit HisH [Gammaproteobacteria bacterium]|nr:imidazole glycerol phosphate synthase subunit HisH [Gammaproteobacteria bacterium]